MWLVSGHIAELGLITRFVSLFITLSMYHKRGLQSKSQEDMVSGPTRARSKGKAGISASKIHSIFSSLAF